LQAIAQLSGVLICTHSQQCTFRLSEGAGFLQFVFGALIIALGTGAGLESSGNTDGTFIHQFLLCATGGVATRMFYSLAQLFSDQSGLNLSPPPVGAYAISIGCSVAIALMSVHGLELTFGLAFTSRAMRFCDRAIVNPLVKVCNQYAADVINMCPRLCCLRVRRVVCCCCDTTITW
jgi:hypothetical protein